jgi:hypothetical protein
MRAFCGTFAVREDPCSHKPLHPNNLSIKIPPFHGGNTGANPGRVANRIRCVIRLEQRIYIPLQPASIKQWRYWFCRIVQLMLPDELYCVEASHSVADAIGAVANKSFDIYVLDYKLQDGSGFDVAERIRSKWGGDADHSHVGL